MKSYQFCNYQTKERLNLVKLSKGETDSNLIIMSNLLQLVDQKFHPYISKYWDESFKFAKPELFKYQNVSFKKSGNFLIFFSVEFLINFCFSY